MSCAGQSIMLCECPVCITEDAAVSVVELWHRCVRLDFCRSCRCGASTRFDSVRFFCAISRSAAYRCVVSVVCSSLS